MKGRTKKLVKWLLQIVATIFLLILAVGRLDTGELKSVLLDMNLLVLFPVCFLLFLDLLINSYRILHLYRFYGVIVKVKKVLLVKLQGFFFSLLFPLIGDAYKIQAFKSTYGSSYAKNSLVVLLDRLIYTFALTIVLLPVWLFSIIEVGVVLKIFIFLLLALELLILYFINQPEKLNQLLSIIKFMKSIFRFTNLKYEKRDHYIRAIAKNTIIAILRHSLMAFVYMLIAYSLLRSIEFDIIMFVLIVFTVMLSRVIPVSVGGIGLREYIATLIFPTIGIATEYAFSIAFVISSLMILQGILGGILVLWQRIYKVNNVLAEG